MVEKWIQTIHPHAGALHRALHIREDQPIPLQEELDILKLPIGEHYRGIEVTTKLKKQVGFAVNIRRPHGRK